MIKFQDVFPTNETYFEYLGIVLFYRLSSLLKRWLLGTHHRGQQFSHLHYYLDEFTFRFNRRKSHSRGKLFYRLVQQALEVQSVTLKSIKYSD